MPTKLLAELGVVHPSSDTSHAWPMVVGTSPCSRGAGGPVNVQPRVAVTRSEMLAEPPPLP